MMLLPSLFAEADNRDYLLFQCVPGISKTKSAARYFESTAGSVAYLVDGDPGGVKLRTDLIEDGGEAEDHIFTLQSDEQALETEDLIDRAVYSKAVNEVIADMRTCGAIPIEAIPDVGRVDAVDAWIESKGEDPLSKRSVAERVLDLRNEGPILDVAHKQFLKRMLLSIEDDALKIPKDSKRTQ